MKLLIGCFIFLAMVTPTFSQSLSLTNFFSTDFSFPEKATVSLSGTNRLTVAVISFENKTGNPSNDCWRFAASHLIDKALSEAKAIRSLPGTDYALKKMNKKDGDPINKAEAKKIGELIEARRVIWGDYQLQGTNWLVRVQVLNVATGKAIELSAVSADWFELRDNLSGQIFRQLNVKPTPAEQQKIQRRLTRSPKTLEYLSQAMMIDKEERSNAQIEELMNKALAADPKCAEAYVILGAATGSQGKFKNGEKNARQAIELKPDSVFAHRTLGHFLVLQEKHGEAEDELLEAIRLDSDDAESLELLGELYSTQDKNMLAVIYFKKAIRLDPLNAAYRAVLGYSFAKQGEREMALSELKLAEQLALKDEVNPEQFLSQAYDILHEVPSAIEHYELFVKLAKKQGLNPEMVQSFDKILGLLKSSLTPVYVEAKMPKEYTPDDLAKILREKLTAAEFVMVTNPLASTPEMDRWAKEMTAGATNDLEKAQMLFDKLTRHIDTKNQGNSKTAQEVFEAWNQPGQSFVCKEYANFYVALARAVGLKAFFVMVSEEVDGLKALHACAGVFIDGKLLLVDPTYRWFGVPHKQFLPLDDVQTVGVHSSQSERNPMEAGIACKLAPSLSVTHFNLFFSLMTNEKWKAASEVLTNALSIEPNSAMANAAQGMWALHENQPERAIVLLKKSTEMDPAQGDVFYILAVAYAKLEQLPEERECLRKALRCGLNDKNAEVARQEIANINEAIGNN